MLSPINTYNSHSESFDIKTRGILHTSGIWRLSSWKVETTVSIFRVKTGAAFSLEQLTIGIYLGYLDGERKLIFKLIVKEYFGRVLTGLSLPPIR